jgi:hypothetical protein
METTLLWNNGTTEKPNPARAHHSPPILFIFAELRSIAISQSTGVPKPKRDEVFGHLRLAEHCGTVSAKSVESNSLPRTVQHSQDVACQ